MIFIGGGEGDPRILADFCLRERLEITDSALRNPLYELAANKACEGIYFSYDIKTEKPHLFVISRFAEDVRPEQMLEVSREALGSLASMCTSEPQFRSVHLDTEDWYSDEGNRQDLFLLEGSSELVQPHLMLSAEHFIHNSTFRLNFYEDEQECQLSDVCQGLTPVLPNDIRRAIIMFVYDSEQKRHEYIDPQEESYDRGGRRSRYQDDWLSRVAGYRQDGVTVEEHSFNLKPWPPRNDST